MADVDVSDNGASELVHSAMEHVDKEEKESAANELEARNMVKCREQLPVRTILYNDGGVRHTLLTNVTVRTFFPRTVEGVQNIVKLSKQSLKLSATFEHSVVQLRCRMQL